VERSGPQEVVQYRDEISSIFDVSTLLLERRRRRVWRLRRAGSRTIQVIVVRQPGGRVGIVVARILDAVTR
jgi:chemotaxis protein histidine kinase CheA